MIGTANQIAWAEQIRVQVSAEFDRVRKALESAAEKQSGKRRADTEAMIAILEEKRAEVMAREEAGYFIHDWQETEHSGARPDYRGHSLQGDQSVTPPLRRGNRAEWGERTDYCCGLALTDPLIEVPMTSPETTNSTRRFCCRPADVSLVATGWLSPNPWEPMEDVTMPCPNQEIANRVRAVFRQAHVELVRSHAVGMAFHFEPQSGIGQNDAGDLGQLLARAGLERILPGVEKNVRHVDDEASGAVAGLQDGVELQHQFVAQFLLLALGLSRLRDLLRLLGLRASTQLPCRAAATLRPQAPHPALCVRPALWLRPLRVGRQAAHPTWCDSACACAAARARSASFASARASAAAALAAASRPAEAARSCARRASAWFFNVISRASSAVCTASRAVIAIGLVPAFLVL